MSKEKHPIESWVEKINGAIFLIFIGIIFLLNTTGIAPWSVWPTFFITIIKLWPFWLIWIGLQIIFSGSQIIKAIMTIISSIITMSIFSAIIFASIYKITLPEYFNNWNFTFVSAPSIEKSQEIKTDDFVEAKTLTYDFDFNAGNFILNTNKKSSDFLKLDSQYSSNNGVPNMVSELNDSDLKIKFKQDFAGINFWGSKLEYNFDLNSNKLPTQIKINLTAGDLKADLKNLNLSRLNLVMTAGSSTIELNDSVENVIAELTAGSLKLQVPKELTLILNTNSTAGSISVDGRELKNEVATFEGSSINELKLTLRQTAGSIEIDRI